MDNHNQTSSHNPEMMSGPSHLRLSSTSLSSSHLKKPNRSTAIHLMRRYFDSVPKKAKCRDELTDYQFWKSVRTEFLSTLILVIIGSGICLTSPSNILFSSSSDPKTIQVLVGPSSSSQVVLRSSSSSSFIPGSRVLNRPFASQHDDSHSSSFPHPNDDLSVHPSPDDVPSAESIRLETTPHVTSSIHSVNSPYLTSSSSSSSPGVLKSTQQNPAGEKSPTLLTNQQSTSDEKTMLISLLRTIDVIKTSLGIGLLTSVLMFITSGRIKNYMTGCHLNPFITLSLFLTRHDVSSLKLFMFVTFQLLASVVGSCILFGLSFCPKIRSHDNDFNGVRSESLDHESSRNIFMATLPSAKTSLPPTNIFGFEFLASFLIVLSYFALTDSRYFLKRNTVSHLNRRRRRLNSNGSVAGNKCSIISCCRSNRNNDNNRGNNHFSTYHHPFPDDIRRG